MSNYYLCDICKVRKLYDYGDTIVCEYRRIPSKKPVNIDGIEPEKICKLFERKADNVR